MGRQQGKGAHVVAARTEKNWATEIPNKLEKRIDSSTVCRVNCKYLRWSASLG